MPKRMNSFETHDFYCINCGYKGIPLTRQVSKGKKSFHRKRLYCWHCKHTVNHIECRNDAEKLQFISDFAAGLYKAEAAEELKYELEHPKYQNYLKGLK